MADHAKFAALAKRLITKHGRTVTFKQLPNTPVDPTKPWKGAATAPTVIATSIAVFVPPKGLEFGTDFLDEQLLKSCTEVCLANADADLTKAHLLHDGGQDFKINWVRRLQPADIALVYAIGVER